MAPNVTHVGVSIAAVDGPELAAVDCDHRIRKQIQLLAQHNKPAANIASIDGGETRDIGRRHVAFINCLADTLIYRYAGGKDGSRTRLAGFTGRCITALAPQHGLHCCHDTVRSAATGVSITDLL